MVFYPYNIWCFKSLKTLTQTTACYIDEPMKINQDSDGFLSFFSDIIAINVPANSRVDNGLGWMRVMSQFSGI
jgi:hypothetical protein